MANTVTDLINTIDITFPVAGQDNDSQGFRNNFNIIRSSLLLTEGQIDNINNTISTLGSAVYTTATHLVALQDVKIGTTNTVVLSVNSNKNLVATFNTSSMVLVGASQNFTLTLNEALDDHGGTTATQFSVNTVNSIVPGAIAQIGTETTTVTAVQLVNAETNLYYVTVSPYWTLGTTSVTFSNPYTPVVGNLSIDGDLDVSGSITTNTLDVNGFVSLPGGATVDGLTITNAATIGSTLGVSSTLPTLGAATGGAVAVSGGVGIAKDLFVGTTATVQNLSVVGNITSSASISDTTPTSSVSSGALQVAGGAGIAGGLVVGGVITATNISITGASSSFTQNGYTTLPGGLVMQWGLVGPFALEGGQLVTFPIPFPNAVLNAQVSYILPSAGVRHDESAQIYSLSNTDIGVYFQVFGGGTADAGGSIYWQAIGY